MREKCPNTNITDCAQRASRIQFGQEKAVQWQFSSG